MNKNIRFVISALVAGLLSISAVSSSALGLGDEAKLKEFEQAMKAPSDTNVVKKPRTRAIVFDNDSTQATAPATESKSARIADCSSLPLDVKAITVDFAIQFKVGSADVAPTSEDTLRQIAKILALSPDRCVLVEGHSDASGSLDVNMSLSRERAASVVKFIVDKVGMDKSRFFAIGKGPNEPLKNLDPRDPKNRRVVFKVVG
jgi:outer membrane protein OmpA-like peptidoglycan-associated protein